MATQVGLDNKIDKVLKVPEIIVTSSTNTLALKGLEVSSSAQNQVVTIDPLTGVLNRSSFLSTVEENVVDYRATEGQLCLTPSPITTLNKVNVYRNGIRINASVVGSSTIKLEKAASCYLNDEIKYNLTKISNKHKVKKKTMKKIFLRTAIVMAILVLASNKVSAQTAPEVMLLRAQIP
jgi:hypothetical protein